MENRPRSRSRRSHPTFSHLRLAPLATDPSKLTITASPVTPGNPAIEDAYRQHHPSYLTARSAPTSPRLSSSATGSSGSGSRGGILSRSTTRHSVHGGLSLKTADADPTDAENRDPSGEGYFGYEAVPVAAHGGTREYSAGALDESRRKAKSESVLGGGAEGVRTAARRKAPAGQPSHTTKRGPRRHDDTGAAESWLTHATQYTTTLLAEGKGQSWASPLSSSASLHPHPSRGLFTPLFHDHHPDYDIPHPADDDDAALDPVVPPSPSLLLRSPAVPPLGWGSRFGSRPASAAPSRRGSRAQLHPYVAAGAPGPRTAAPRRGPSRRADEDDAAAVGVPDFVDPTARAEMEASLRDVARDREAVGEGYFAGAAALEGHGGGGDEERGDGDDEEEDDEAHVARLARTPGLGIGFLDAIVGLAAFGGEGGVGAEEEDDEVEVGAGRGRRAVEVPALARRAGAVDAKRDEEDAAGGWADAAWLLSVASKVLF